MRIPGPFTVVRAVLSLPEIVLDAGETVRTARRVVTRLDEVTSELEGPVRQLVPGIERLARVLDDPAVEQVPETLTAIRRDVLPVLKVLADTNERMAALPGAALFGLRRPAPKIVDG